MDFFNSSHNVQIFPIANKLEIIGLVERQNITLLNFPLVYCSIGMLQWDKHFSEYFEPTTTPVAHRPKSQLTCFSPHWKNRFYSLIFTLVCCSAVQFTSSICDGSDTTASIRTQFSSEKHSTGTPKMKIRQCISFPIGR